MSSKNYISVSNNENEIWFTKMNAFFELKNKNKTKLNVKLIEKTVSSLKSRLESKCVKIASE